MCVCVTGCGRHGLERPPLPRWPVGGRSVRKCPGGTIKHWGFRAVWVVLSSGVFLLFQHDSARSVAFLRGWHGLAGTFVIIHRRVMRIEIHIDETNIRIAPGPDF